MEQQIAYDRATRRASNDGRRYFFGGTKPLIGFVCECAAPSCFETVRLSAREFDDIRPGSVLAVGHREDA